MTVSISHKAEEGVTRQTFKNHSEHKYRYNINLSLDIWGYSRLKLEESGAENTETMTPKQ